MEQAKFGDVDVAIKSFYWKYSDSMIEVFKNEISTFQILQERRAKNDLEENKSLLHIADYVGFILNDSCDPCYGSIVTQWYSMGNLSTYSHKISSSIWFDADSKEMFDKLGKKFGMPTEIIIMTDIARQIATGIFNLKLSCNLFYQYPFVVCYSN